eukprot:TRINITY_DN604_c0_g1_i3.p2 TRINITY_DN604_c0_g1~~TRINITY_DN604_c0_g1_i3.p2  ORF type:complete len:130 (+),score=36.57 TRINITY_DN604_c0_g1_i3:222-611(+)
MLFKDGIAPEWEHPANSKGGHFQIQLKPAVGGAQIDEYWNNTVLGMIGGTLEPSDIITGIRLVDKLAGGKLNAAIRMELWFTSSPEASVNLLRSSMERCMGQRLDGTFLPLNGSVPKPEMKLHSGISTH